MKNILNLEKTLFEISQVLGLDDKLQRLLVIDKPDALTAQYIPLTLNDLLEQEYITLAPHLENAIVKNDRNTFLIIHFQDINFHSLDDNIKVEADIYVLTDKNHVLLDQNKHRLLQIINRISEILDGTKFSSAGQLVVNYAESCIYSEYSFGYRVNFSFIDQNNGKAEL